MKFYLFLLLCIIYYSQSVAQSFKYRKYNFEWPAQHPEPILLDSVFKNEDAVILDENCIYNQGGNRVPEYYFLNYQANYVFVDKSVQGISPVVKKHVRIKFLTQKGIDKFRRIVLPESFDPSADYYNVRPQWRDSILRPLGEFECVRYFAARIIKPDGSVTKANINESTREEIIYGAIITKKYYNWIFEIADLKVGDEVELDYSYEGVYNYGKSERIFFNTDMPIQKLDFTFRFPENKLYILNYHNGVLPKDSTMVTLHSPHYTEYYFHLEKLHGGIREPGGRPYKQFPYFSFYYHDRNYGIPDPKTEFIKTPLPYPWSYAMLPYTGYQYEDLDLRLSRKDNTTIVLNEYTEELKRKAEDTSSAYVISKMQEDIANNFDFKEDPGYYMGEAPDLERLGKNIENKTFRQMSRMRAYDEVLMRLDKPYFHALFTDKRIAEIDMNRYESPISSRLSIAIPYKEFILHFYPKSYRFGYEPNELPFYYEDIASFLTPQHEISEKKYELIPRVEFKFIRTPASDQNNNLRNTASKMSISLDSLKVNVQVKIRLSGQFSTLTRGYYQYGSIDTTINPSYFNVIALNSDKDSKLNTEVSPVGNKFPFDVTVTQEFTSNNHLKKTGDKEYSFNLGNWFNNIIEEEFHSENRYLDYYPDFQSQDIHRYFIHFDHPIEISNIAGFRNKISNSFTDYEINVSQPTQNDVLLESSYLVKAAIVPASDAAYVEAAFKAIHDLNSTELKIHRID